MIDVHKLVDNEQSYTFVTDDEIVHVAVDRLNCWLIGMDFPFYPIELKPFYDAMIKRCAVDERIVAALPAAALFSPITLVEMPDGTVIPVDGTHRAVKFYREGYPNILAYIVPARLWRRFQISGIPGDAEFWNASNRVPERMEYPTSTI